MSAPQMKELTDALQTFNNVSLPALSFFFAVMFLVIIGLLIRGLFGRDKRRDDLMALSMKSSADNGVAITGVKQDIANALNVIHLDSIKADERHDKTIRVLSGRIRKFDSNVMALNEKATTIATAINKVNDAIAEIKVVVPTLATKSEMDLAIGRMDDAIKKLEQARLDCIERKHDSKELPLVTLPIPTDKATILLTGVEPKDIELPKTG